MIDQLQTLEFGGLFQDYAEGLSLNHHYRWLADDLFHQQQSAMVVVAFHELLLLMVLQYQPLFEDCSSVVNCFNQFMSSPK